VEIRQTYRYNASPGSSPLESDIVLQILQFEGDLHLSILREDQTLWIYEIYDIEGIKETSVFSGFFYKWISISGFVPSRVDWIVAAGNMWLLPTLPPYDEGWKGLPMFQHQPDSVKVVLNDAYDLVFSKNTFIEKALKQVFPDFHCKSFPVLIHEFIGGYEFMPERFALLVCMSNKICLWLQEDGALVSFIIKPFSEKNDILYYTLKAMELAKMQVDRTPLFVSGMVSAQSPIFELLRSYISAVEMLDVPLFSNINRIPDFFDTSLMQ